MATNRLGFRQFRNKLLKNEEINIVLDSNILIANFDEVHSSHEEVRKFLNEIGDITSVNCYTTVTTKSEFLDYFRKKFLTEGIFDLVDEYNNDIPLSSNAKAAINVVKGRRNKRQKDENQKIESDPDYEFDVKVVHLTDNEIKEIKKKFRAGDIENETGWLKVCHIFLKSKLLAQEVVLDELCIYLSPHKEEQKDLFLNPHVDWKKATSISGESGMGFSDSLILNMLLHTKIDFIVTLDFDMVYATAVSAMDKWVVLPDNRLKSFKASLKGLQQ
jgi:predicted nucleic acid-binding protein